MRRMTVLAVLVLIVSACGGEASDTSASTASTSTSSTATTTTAPATTTTTTTTMPATTAAPTTTTPSTTLAPSTTAPDLGYTVDDLPRLVVVDGDPWVIPVADPRTLALTIDDVWPADTYPTERTVYEEAGFVAGYFSAFLGDPEGLLLSGAHLFEDASGARAGLEVLEGSFTDTDLVARITQLQPGTLTNVVELPAPGFGDASATVLLFGPARQVVGVIWTTDNVLQFVRTNMVTGDEQRTEAAILVAAAMARRAG